MAGVCGPPRWESLRGVSGMGWEALSGVRVLWGEAGGLLRAGLVSGSGEGSLRRDGGCPGKEWCGRAMWRRGEGEARMSRRSALAWPGRGLGGGVWRVCAISMRSSSERGFESDEVGFFWRAGVTGERLVLDLEAGGGDACVSVAGCDLGA